MIRTPLLALAGLVVACSGDDDTDAPPPPPPPDCADWWLDADRDGFGDDSSDAESICDGTEPEGYVQNAEDCDDLDPDENPLADELCDLLGRDENCNGLVDGDDPSVADTVDTYPDEDGDGFGVPGPTEQSCASAPGRSRNTDDCDDTDPTVFPGAAEFEGDITVCTQDADRDGYGALNPTNPAAVPGTDCDDSDDASYPNAPEVFGDGVDQDCDGEDLDSIRDSFEGGADAALWATLSGDWLISTTYARSGTSSLNLGGGGTRVTTVPVDFSVCSESVDWSFWAKRGPEAPDSGEDLVFEAFDGTQWRLVGVVLGQSITDPTFVRYMGSITEASIFSSGVQFRWSTSGSGPSNDDYFMDDVEISCL